MLVAILSLETNFACVTATNVTKEMIIEGGQHFITKKVFHISMFTHQGNKNIFRRMAL